MNHRRNGSETFAALQAELQTIRTRPEITVKSGPSPAKLAPHAISLNATVEVAGQPMADGRLVILHDPAGQESWQGTWRIILMASADVDTSTGEDPVLIDMGWTWLQEALGERELAVGSFGGTVTRTASRSYGILDDRPATADLQIRASWTPAVDQPHPGLPVSEISYWENLAPDSRLGRKNEIRCVSFGVEWEGFKIYSSSLPYKEMAQGNARDQ